MPEGKIRSAVDTFVDLPEFYLVEAVIKSVYEFFQINGAVLICQRIPKGKPVSVPALGVICDIGVFRIDTRYVNILVVYVAPRFIRPVLL